jgi:toluene monooxygenase system protein E
VCSSWEKFRDPRETTYTKYTDLQREKEIFVDGILDEIELTGYDAHLHPAWLRVFPRVVAPFRYPGHGFQMIASYVGQMAPSGRITIAAALQSADEMRRVQRIAYRIRQLQLIYPGFAADSKTLWQTDTLWQPLREVVEKLLITYDWAESFVGLNLVLKPLVDELFMKHLSDVALREDDYLLGQIFYSLNEDCQWHRQWSESLVRMAIEDNTHNRDTIQSWINQWYPLASRAVNRFALLFADTPERTKAPPLQRTDQAIDGDYRNYLRSMELQVAPCTSA